MLGPWNIRQADPLPEAFDKSQQLARISVPAFVSYAEPYTLLEQGQHVSHNRISVEVCQNRGCMCAYDMSILVRSDVHVFQVKSDQRSVYQACLAVARGKVDSYYTNLTNVMASEESSSEPCGLNDSKARMVAFMTA
jgi:hypothetical protein